VSSCSRLALLLRCFFSYSPALRAISSAQPYENFEGRRRSIADVRIACILTVTSCGTLWPPSPEAIKGLSCHHHSTKCLFPYLLDNSSFFFSERDVEECSLASGSELPGLRARLSHDDRAASFFRSPSLLSIIHPIENGKPGPLSLCFLSPRPRRVGSGDHFLSCRLSIARPRQKCRRQTPLPHLPPPNPSLSRNSSPLAGPRDPSTPRSFLHLRRRRGSVVTAPPPIYSLPRGKIFCFPLARRFPRFFSAFKQRYSFFDEVPRLEESDPESCRPD